MNTFQTYKATFDSNPDSLLVVDNTGKIVMVNNQVELLFGYKSDELKEQHINMLIPSQNIEKHNEYVKQYFESPQKRTMDSDKSFKIYKKNGDEAFVDIQLNPVLLKENNYTIVAIRDITEKVKSKEELEKAKKRLMYTLDNMLEGAQIIGFDWRYLYVNDTFVKHSKYTREKLQKYTVLELYPGIENTPIYDIYLKCFVERVSIHLENEFVFPDGSVGWFDLSFQPIPEGIFILSIDITERKLAEIKLISQNKELIRMNKELEQFAYITSHDLQEPLKSLISFTQLIQAEFGGKFDADFEQYFYFIRKSSERMKLLIKGLLDYSRIGKNKELTLVNCNNICNTILRNLDASIKESNAKIQINNLPELSGYEIELGQLFQNLISNALKFRKKDISPIIQIKAEKKKKHWLFSIQDNGIGIEKEHFEKIFLIYQRLHNRNDYEGTGIGLAYCKKIIDLHKGEIWVESELNKGSIFYFTLPII
ncbi:MAG: hypothetical protein A2046_10370 [Bacteroidetes bacterium GWA2_30_7]|nr:MAG: hypothetical protein A2046_10370 [Bacteroidetes bacterium GWA2_30_7]